MTKMKWLEKSELTGVTAINLRKQTKKTPEAKIDKRDLIFHVSYGYGDNPSSGAGRASNYLIWFLEQYDNFEEVSQNNINIIKHHGLNGDILSPKIIRWLFSKGHNMIYGEKAKRIKNCNN